MTAGREFDKGTGDASPSVEQRFVRSALAARLFGSNTPARLAGYHLIGRAGSGGMGLVFEARDAHTGQRVALKVLRSRGDGALERLKREFRTLAELYHPHLVQLYELSLDGDIPFLTMEFVQGDTLLNYLKREPGLRLERLASCMAQLVDAVRALHRAGFVHRDLKPTNVLVDTCERIVLLDFGLACTIGEQADARGTISGTPLYMAPERLKRAPSAEAQDWYSIGVTLLECLEVPLTLRADGTLDRTPLSATLRSVRNERTASLIDLSLALLDDVPEHRRDGAALAAYFGVPRTASATSMRGGAGDDLVVGRERELDVLQSGLHRARRGTFTLVHISGAPGIGKTALARHFIRHLQHDQTIVGLTSRCYEREFIAYNAIDGVLEAALFLELAEGSEGGMARGYRVRAAELLMRSSLVEESVRVVAALLSEAGLEYPRSIAAAHRTSAAVMTRLSQSQLTAERPRRVASEIESLRIELCLSLGYRSVLIDPARGAVLLLQALDLALECGSDGQLARALACHAVIVATLDKPESGEPLPMLERARALAAREGPTQAMAWVLLFKAMTHHTQTSWLQAKRAAYDARIWIQRHHLLDCDGCFWSSRWAQRPSWRSWVKSMLCTSWFPLLCTALWNSATLFKRTGCALKAASCTSRMESRNAPSRPIASLATAASQKRLRQWYQQPTSTRSHPSCSRSGALRSNSAASAKSRSKTALASACT